MPDKPLWFHELPVILERFRSMRAPVVGRAVIEAEFGLKRRQAIYLMNKVGGWEAGRTFLVERVKLIAWLEGLARGDDFAIEERRRLRLSESLAEARRTFSARQVRIETDSLPGPAGLPGGVELRRGELRIEFSGVEDLLSKLFDLSKAIAGDYDDFCRRFVPE